MELVVSWLSEDGDSKISKVSSGLEEGSLSGILDTVDGVLDGSDKMENNVLEGDFFSISWVAEDHGPLGEVREDWKDLNALLKLFWQLEEQRSNIGDTVDDVRDAWLLESFHGTVDDELEVTVAISHALIDEVGVIVGGNSIENTTNEVWEV